MDGKFKIPVLTNEEQIYIMDMVKSKNISVNKAIELASQLHLEPHEEPAELRKNPKSRTTQPLEEVFNFSITFYPNGFNQNGFTCYMQIDFSSRIITIVSKWKTIASIKFEFTKGFSNVENSCKLKILTENGVYKFIANSVDKDFIFELLGMVVLDNECCKLDNNKKKDLDRTSMNLVFRNRKILKKGILEKKIDANMIFWVVRHVEVKEGEFLCKDLTEKSNGDSVQLWTNSVDVNVISDSEFCISHNKKNYTFRVNMLVENVKDERDSWIKAFLQASARKKIKTEWMEKVRLPHLIEEESGDNVDFSGMQLNSPNRLENETNGDQLKPECQVKSPQPTLKVVPPPITPPPPIPPPPPILLPTTPRKFNTQNRLKYFPIPCPSKKLLESSIWPSIASKKLDLDYKLLEEKFAVKHKIKDKKDLITNKGKIYLNSKKAQNIMILMKGRFLNTVKEIPSVFVSIEGHNSVTLEDIRILQKYQPNNDEIEMYHKLKMENVELRPVDSYMSKLSSIPFLRDRLELIHTIWSFQEKCKEFEQLISLATIICEEILNSKRLERVLAYVLAIFNYLNTSGNMSETLCCFDVNYLSQLHSANGVGNYSVLNALKHYMLNDPDKTLNEFTKDLPNLISCETFSIKSLNINLEVWKQTLTNVKSSTASLEKGMKTISSEDKIFFSKVSNFYDKEIQTYLESSIRISKIHNKYQHILKKFALDGNTSSETLFNNLQIFAREYENLP